MRLTSTNTLVNFKNNDESLTLELPLDGLPLAPELSGTIADEALFLLALKYFELGRIPSGKAGRLCGMGRVEFLLAASRVGVSMADMNAEELQAEFN